MAPRFSLGIDLGTSNSAAAIEDFEGDRAEIVEITQVLGPNQAGEKATLPSALYVPHPDEFPGRHAAAVVIPPERPPSSGILRGSMAPLCQTA